MPYISLTTPQHLEAPQKQALSKDFGAIISLLPGKTENALFIDFCEGHTMYFRGQEMRNFAYVQVHLYGAAGFADKNAFTEKIFELLQKHLGLKSSEASVSIWENSTWGSGGKLK